MTWLQRFLVVTLVMLCLPILTVLLTLSFFTIMDWPFVDGHHAAQLFLTIVGLFLGAISPIFILNCHKNKIDFFAKQLFIFIAICLAIPFSIIMIISLTVGFARFDPIFIKVVVFILCAVCPIFILNFNQDKTGFFVNFASSIALIFIVVCFTMFVSGFMMIYSFISYFYFFTDEITVIHEILGEDKWDPYEPERAPNETDYVSGPAPIFGVLLIAFLSLALSFVYTGIFIIYSGIRKFFYESAITDLQN